jgi:hypothetical protein
LSFGQKITKFGINNDSAPSEPLCVGSTQNAAAALRLVCWLQFEAIK